MSQTPPEVVMVSLLFLAFWLALVLAILVAGQYRPAIRSFRERMVSKWKPALVIVGLFILGIGLGGRGFFNPYAIDRTDDRI